MTPMAVQPKIWLAVGMLALPALALAGAACAENTTLAITIKDHKFTPEELRIPAGKAVVLQIKNEDASAEEFEFAHAQDREGDRSRQGRNRAPKPAEAGPLSLYRGISFQHGKRRHYC